MLVLDGWDKTRKTSNQCNTANELYYLMNNNLYAPEVALE